MVSIADYVQREITSMLAFITMGIAFCSITVCLVFGQPGFICTMGLDIAHLLQEEFRTAGRRLTGNIGLFAIPITVYLLNWPNKSVNNAEPFAFAWGACYVLNLLMLAAGLITLMRDANRERKTGLYRFRR